MTAFSDPLVETATQRLDLIYSKAAELVKRWFPEATDPRDRRIAVLAAMKDLVALAQIEAAVLPSGSAFPPEATSALGIPKIDPADLATAGWTTYKTKQPAEVNAAAWIKNPAYFTDFEAPPVVLELVKALNKTEKKRLRLGDMDYFFSGEGKFLSRRPAKKEKAK